MSSRLAAALNKGPRVQNIDLGLIDVPPNRAREFNPGAIEDLVASIKTIGLLHPITVRLKGSDPLKPRYELISGLHRLRAHERMGAPQIPATIVTLDDTKRELAELDENLQRSTLSALELAEHLKRRDELLDELGLRPRVGRQPDDAGETITTQDLADGLGISKRSYQASVSVGRISRRIRDQIRGTALEDRKTDLVELARIKDEDEQEQLVTAIATGQASTLKEAKAYISAPKSPAPAAQTAPSAATAYPIRPVDLDKVEPSAPLRAAKYIEPINLSDWSRAADSVAAGLVVVTPLPKPKYLVDAAAYFGALTPDVGIAQGYVATEEQEILVVWATAEVPHLPSRTKSGADLARLIEMGGVND